MNELGPKLGSAKTRVEGCACFNLRRAARMVTRVYDDALRPAGLGGSQFTLTAALRLLGETSIQQLADAVGMDRTTLTRNLRPLERDGLVVSAPGTDRRQRLVTLTDRGREALDKAIPLWEGAQEELRTLLGSTRMTGLVDELAAVARLVQEAQLSKE